MLIFYNKSHRRSGFRLIFFFIISGGEAKLCSSFINTVEAEKRNYALLYIKRQRSEIMLVFYKKKRNA